VRKGTVLTPEHIARILSDGVTTLVVARPGDGDVLEDVAAARIAQAVAGPGTRCARAFTGRANLIANEAGLVRISADTVVALNRLDEALTLATVAPDAPADAGQIVATAKIIPFAVPSAAVTLWEEHAQRERPALSVRPFRPRRVGFVLTQVVGGAESALDRATATMRARLERRGSALALVRRCPHDAPSVAACVRECLDAGAHPVLVLGASQVADRADVIPQAMRSVGGRVHRFGLAVDPGNLTVIGQAGDASLLGVPGCARSGRPSGFDRVLDEVLVGGDPTTLDFAAMGVGGLLKEIASRPQPRRGV